MDRKTLCCPNPHGPARGQTGRGNLGIHSQKDHRCLCHVWHNTFSATQGTVLYRLRTSAETVVIVVTLLAHGCPAQRTVADWWARAGRQGQAVHEYLVEQPRDLGQVQADEIRVKTQGRIVWMALALMVKPRVGLGGEVSAQRDLPLIRRLSARVRRGAAHRPLLVCTDGVAADIRALRETFRAPVHNRHGRTTATASMAEWLDRPSRQALRAATCGRDRTPYCRWHTGTRGDAPMPVARRRGHQYGIH